VVLTQSQSCNLASILLWWCLYRNLNLAILRVVSFVGGLIAISILQSCVYRPLVMALTQSHSCNLACSVLWWWIYLILNLAILHVESFGVVLPQSQSYNLACIVLCWRSYRNLNLACIVLWLWSFSNLNFAILRLSSLVVVLSKSQSCNFACIVLCWWSYRKLNLAILCVASFGGGLIAISILQYCVYRPLVVVLTQSQSCNLACILWWWSYRNFNLAILRVASFGGGLIAISILQSCV
jgi:hypothetical protein